jgi:ERF superfamily protein
MSLHAKLSELRKELAGTVKKGAKNERLNYSFVEAKTLGKDFVLAASARGLTMLPVTQELVDTRLSSSEKQTVMSIKTTWGIFDTETDEVVFVEAFGQGADQGDKALPKAQTNAMKYAILLVLQAAGDDPEADPKTDELEAGEASGPKMMSANQKKLIFAKAKDKGFDKAGLQAIVFSTVGKHSMTQIEAAEVDKILDAIASLAPVAEPSSSPQT